MLAAFALSLHSLAAIIWVGGMFFAHLALRPAANALLQPPQRLPLMLRIFDGFFPWVWAAILVLLFSGYGLIFSVFGGMGQIRLYIHLMMGSGTLMMLLFAYLYFLPYQRMRRALAEQNMPASAKHLGQIRLIILINLLLGLITSALGAGGRYF